MENNKTYKLDNKQLSLLIALYEWGTSSLFVSMGDWNVLKVIVGGRPGTTYRPVEYNVRSYYTENERVIINRVRESYIKHEVNK